MLAKASDTTKSKLVERLRQISRGAPAPLGFGRTVETTVKAIAVLAVLPRNDPSLAEAAVRAGADAIALRICGAATDLLQETGDLAAETGVIQETVASLGDRSIVGLVVGSNGAIDETDLSKLGGLGVDFIAAYPHLTPAGFLELSNVGRVAIVDQQGGAAARGINDLSIQAVLLRTDRPGDSPLAMTVLDVATFRAAADGIHRPMIAFPSWTVSTDDVEILKNAGIEGLALVGPEPDATPETLEASIRPYADVVARLGKPVGRRVALAEPSVILPRLAAPASDAEVGEPDEDDE
jgi:hypothetical protein